MKTGGLGDQLYLNGVDLSGDVSAISKIGGGPAALDVTSIQSYATERIGGRRDGTIDFASWFDPYGAGVPTGVWKLPVTDVIGTYFRGETTGNDGAGCVAKQLNWDGTRAADGAFSFTCALQANGYGLEWGTQLTNGLQTDATSPGSGTGVDSGAVGASFGAQAYIHVFSVLGTSVTVSVQDFTTDVPGSYTDVTGLVTGAITPAMCPYAVRLATPNNALIRRWARAHTVGTFTNCNYAVLLVRNPVAGVSF